MATVTVLHRKKQLNDNGVHAAILRCATELFAEKGFSGVSTRDIAARVGIKQASLYHHFMDKKSIHDAVVANSVAHVSDKLLQALRTDANAEDRLRCFIFAALELFDSSNPHSRITDRELMENGNENMTYLTDSLRAPFLELANLVQAISQDMDNENAEHVSFFIFSLAYGARKHSNVRRLLSRLDDLSTPGGMANSLADRILRILFDQQRNKVATDSVDRIRALEEENDQLRRALVDKVLTDIQPKTRRRKA